MTLVLPTYNERQNVERTLRLLDEHLSAQSFSSEIVVIDDASGDGTADVARTFASRIPVRVVVRRREKGLASAILKGFQEARGRVCVAIDADGSHPMSLVGEVVNRVLSGEAEMAIASRYAAGGGITHWPWYRRMLSVGATLLARPLIRGAKVKDPMSGFFAVDKVVLGREPLNPIGFKIGFEILVRCRPRPVVEVPFVFRDRMAGRSKMTGKQVADYLRHLGQLYRFSLFGPSAAARPGKA